MLLVHLVFHLSIFILDLYYHWVLIRILPFTHHFKFLTTICQMCHTLYFLSSLLFDIYKILQPHNRNPQNHLLNISFFFLLTLTSMVGFLFW